MIGSPISIKELHKIKDVQKVDKDIHEIFEEQL